MRRERKPWALGIILGMLVIAAAPVRGGEVSGVVRMPEVCSPSVSPAVVYLSPAKRTVRPTIPEKPGGTEVALVNQRGLQFTPRVQAIALGQSVRFTNQDGETHNVHVVTSGFAFNQSMAPGGLQDFTPDRAGVMILACDVHSHMRGYVVVSPTPWVQVCSRQGRFRLENVPDGRYVLNVWHEMGKPLRKEIVVAGGQSLELPELVLDGPLAPVQVAGSATAPVRPWADVVDRIGMLLADSRQAATRPGEKSRARRLAEDAYWAEFEASDMEVAVRRHLGYVRAGELEQQFRRFRSEVREVAEGRRPATSLDDRSHDLLLDLVAAMRELNDKGVTDAAHIDANHRAGATDELPSLASLSDLGGGSLADPEVLLQALRRGFHRIGEAADRDGSDEASFELTNVYTTEFEPIERYLLGRSPQSIRPLEARFNALRGEISSGLKGDQLTARLDGLYKEVDGLVARLEARPAGAFGTAFFESLITIVREGVEVILVLAMLIALVAKAAQPSAGAAADAARAGAMRAIWIGVALAIGASIATAVALNLTVASVQGRAREILEGAVMLVAAAVLFYVSYWLVSQAQAKRWADFLKRNARRGLEWGGGGTLALTAFLAVYREGAETALMYQALLGSQGTTRAGVVGLAAGLVLGLLILAVVAMVVRATSVRLPIRAFFQISGLCLFALAVIFAGNGVFELQNAGILLTTPLAWLGGGLPLAGLYPNVQVVSVQGLLLAGALLSWVVIPRGALADPAAARKPGGGTKTPLPA
jgi:high-affinity iron transporter